MLFRSRCNDAALAVAPIRHEFGWKATDIDKLASATVAGHVIECGAQATGGNCSYEWQSIERLEDVGYPIVEVQADGSFVVTKHPGTGGRVSRQTVTEQLVYEIGDPRAYITADVVSDFTTITLNDLGGDRVAISGIRGGAPTGKLKVSAAYRDGFTSACHMDRLAAGGVF